jgi:hypothetical protein
MRHDAQRRAREKAKAIAFFPSLSNRDDPGLHSHMFIQDLYSSVVPFSKRRSRTAEITGKEDAREKALGLCRSLARYDSRDVTQAVVGAIEDIAMRLAWNGRAFFEVIQQADEPQITLNSFSSWHLLHLPAIYIQFIPKADREHFGRAERHYIRKIMNLISAKDVWKIEIPRRLGGYSSYKRLLRGFKRVPDVGPDFLTSDLKQRQFTPNFDPGAYFDAQVQYISRITRGWGWNRRDFSLKYDTEFYTFHRTLRFKWAQALLREHIITELNSLLKNYRIDAAINLTGVLTSGEIAVIRTDVMLGKLHYGEALKRLG